ncbi:MAG TPA: N-acetylglucosamine-6-phosphate deacetylase [Gaiellaceae bacterium]|nr:N-acetylglucosamine-6-phosphate deacetylase [Gaiellaceae bacterium]
MTTFDQLGTEARDDAGADLQLRSTLELVELMNSADEAVPAAVGAAAADVARLIDAVADRLASGGRLVYAGTGTSGGLAALDAVECEPTFGVPVTAVVAPDEAAEDDREGGAAAIDALEVSRADAVVAVSASGRSPWALGALAAARRRGAVTGCIVCVYGSELAAIADHEVCIPVGAEVIAGSTRLKAGTAQKLVLNMLSTIAMIRVGRTHGNLMVGLAPLNEKLRARQRSIVAQAAGVSDEQAAAALAGADGDAKAAIRSLVGGAPGVPRNSTRLGVRAALVGGRIVPGDVEVVEGRIAGYGLSSSNGRGIASPGFVDLQVNGFGGVDFLDTDRSGYGRAGEALLETGVTAYLPTLITAPEDRLVAALGEIAAGARGPRILGAHVEGPFLSPRRLGTHPPSARREPDHALLERLLAAGPVRLLTLAPELPGALALVDLLVARGVTVSAGHTDATADEASAAFDRGVRTVTHLFNAMRPFTHRDPGVAGVALARPDVIVQIILDGAHLAADTVRLVWRTAAGRLALVTDAVAGAGVSGDGSYRLGEVAVEVRDGVVRRDDGVLAGSVLTMIEAVRNLHALGVPLEAALEAATAVPARVIGADAGRIEPGAPADLVVLSEELEIERVLVGGEAHVAA